MWKALNNVSENVKRNGLLFIAIYNHQPVISDYWTFVKHTYNHIPLSRPLWIMIHGLYLTLPSIFLKLLKQRKRPRGMATWYDLLDWLGGYPFEVATPKQIFDFYKQKDFSLEQIETVGGKIGCNEYVFRRSI